MNNNYKKKKIKNRIYNCKIRILQNNNNSNSPNNNNNK